MAGLVAARSELYNARLVGRELLTGTLARLWIRADEPIPFDAGRYSTLGLVIDEALVQRPYSTVSAPGTVGQTGYELYVRRVHGGRLSGALRGAPTRDRLANVAPGCPCHRTGPRVPPGRATLGEIFRAVLEEGAA